MIITGLTCWYSICTVFPRLAGSAGVPVPAGEELRVQEVGGEETPVRGHEPSSPTDLPDHCAGRSSSRQQDMGLRN